MDVEHVPGRVALGVTTLLTISSKSAGLSSETPQVSYVKVSDKDMINQQYNQFSKDENSVTIFDSKLFIEKLLDFNRL